MSHLLRGSIARHLNALQPPPNLTYVGTPATGLRLQGVDLPHTGTSRDEVHEFIRLNRRCRRVLFTFVLKFALSGNSAATHLLCWKAFAVCLPHELHKVTAECPAPRRCTAAEFSLIQGIQVLVDHFFQFGELIFQCVQFYLELFCRHCH